MREQTPSRTVATRLQAGEEVDYFDTLCAATKLNAATVLKQLIFRYGKNLVEAIGIEKGVISHGQD